MQFALFFKDYFANADIIDPLVMEYSDKYIVNRLISCDPEFESFFFLKLCNPLLKKISWTIFDNNVSVDELTNEFYCFLKQNEWEKLRTFQFQSSLFYWLKIVATHFFSKNKEKLLPNCLSNPIKNISSLIQNLKDVPRDEILSMLDMVDNQQYHDILYLILVEKKTDNQMMSILGISDRVYKRKKHFAIDCLKNSLINSNSYYAELYFTEHTSCSDNNTSEIPTQDHEVMITKMDVATLLNLMPNDRYRFVVRSLVLEDRDRGAVANEMGISVENLDNIKSRALKQLAEIARKEML